ncbi:MAG: precorrin-8X methylmutase [Pseudomonadota bacterium]
MTQPLFDSYVMVDWSAASKPARGKDSIWLGIAHPGAEITVENIPTRFNTRARLHQICAEAIAAGRRVLVGFDFPFGYPKGVAKHVTGKADALVLWRWLSARLKDGTDNANNRFEVASAINDLYPGIGPFWGRPESWDFPGIPTRARTRTGVRHPPERRLVEDRQRSAQPVWKLYTTGSVGSQVLTGIPAVLALRDDPELASHSEIWPFETGLNAPTKPITFAEIYPSLIPPDPSEMIKDAGQVRAVAGWLRGLDRDGALGPLFAGPPDATADERRSIATEEAWILGLEAPKVRPVGTALPGSAPARRPALRYERSPAEIYRQSFETVRKEAALDHVPEVLHPLAIRLVHACGMPEITARLAWSSDLAAQAEAAFKAGSPVLCDTQAVADMVIANSLPASNRVICTLNDPQTRDISQEIGNTRSAAAVHLWRDKLEGAIVSIGNAPTALFHLLELLDDGWPKPAAILGFPVGFVGAAESKAELASNPRGCAFATLRGRKGGSAMAAAAVNALAAGLTTPA